MKRLIKTLPCAYLLFRFYLLAFNVTAQKVVVMGCVALYVIWNFDKVVGKTPKRIFISNLLLLAAFILWTCVIPTLWKTQDYTFARKMLTKAVDLLFWAAFIIHIIKVTDDGDVIHTFTVEYGRVILLYVLFTVCCLAFPALKERWMSVVAFSESEQELLHSHVGYAGRIGWDGFAGYTSTFMCSLSVLFCCMYLFSDRAGLHREKRDASVYFYLVVSFIGNFLYGRVGTIASVAVLALFLAVNLFSRHKGKQLLTILFFGLLLFALVIALRDRSAVISNVYKWAFEPLLNYLSGRGFVSTSSDLLYEMYFLPQPGTLLFGDGRYTASNGIGYYMRTDAGIMRLVLFWGILPTLLLYLCTVNSLYDSVFGNKLIYLLIIFALFEFKGEICFHMLVIFIAIDLLGENQKRRRRVLLKI